MESATSHPGDTWIQPRSGSRLRSLRMPRPELVALLALAAVLYLWALSQNGWANDYYSAAVRSMSGSWHNFLFGSFDASGLMTVDKPPLALWVQALSVKAFGFGSLSILVPQALMGVASVGLLYDLTRRRWGRSAGFVAGLVLALTPVAVAVSRHNNPDALLVLCSVAALWAFVRALEDGRTRWLVLAGVFVGLGFEAKMGAALMVVPGMALAWLWVAPRGRMVAVRQLLGAGAALLLVALAWPLMVELTPASSRPWIAGTSDNSVFSLILEYNGFGRLDGQAGGPAAFGGGGPFGGASGPLRLLNESLGGQAGWLLGLSLVGAVGIGALSRLRREDPRTGWILAVGGAFLVTAVAFSFAGGIFHPYYVSLLAPFAAALAGAVFAEARGAGRAGRILAAVAIGAGAVTELVVVGNAAGELTWLVPLILILAGGAGVGLVLRGVPDRWRTIALVCGFGVLLVAPAIWSVQTLGHPTSGTFPTGGPESASSMGGPGGAVGPGGPGGPGGAGVPGMNGASGAIPGPGAMPGAGSGGMGAMPGGAALSELGEMPGSGAMPPQGALGFGAGPPGLSGGERGSSPGLPGLGAAGGMFGGQDLSGILAYTEAHGGGTIAVSSQSEAASSIIESGAEVAGIGGFSGKETSVSTAWLREAVADGRIHWILSGGAMAGGPGGGATAVGGARTGAPAGITTVAPGAAGGIGGDTRQGSQSAIEAVTATCTEVPTSAYETSSSGSTATSASTVASAGTLYDCSR